MTFIEKLRNLTFKKNSIRESYARRERAYQRLLSYESLKYLKEAKPWEKECEKAARSGETSIKIMLPTLIKRHRSELLDFLSKEGFDTLFWAKKDGEEYLVIDWKDRRLDGP